MNGKTWKVYTVPSQVHHPQAIDISLKNKETELRNLQLHGGNANSGSTASNNIKTHLSWISCL